MPRPRNADRSAGLTRTMVARALSCSIANVRRLERCGFLHPSRDTLGICRFAGDEVEALAAQRLAKESASRWRLSWERVA